MSGAMSGAATAAATGTVLAVTETEPWFSGSGVLEDVLTLAHDVDRGDWIDAAVTDATLALDLAATFLDPLGTAVQWGVGWVLDHVDPLRSWLDELAGDADQVAAYSASWCGIGAALGRVADAYRADVVSDLDGMTGLVVSGYRGAASGMCAALDAVACAASGLGRALEVCVSLVRAVHDLVRDAIAAIVAIVAEAGLDIIGAAWRAASEAARWASRLGPAVKGIARTVAGLVRLGEELAARLGPIAREMARELVDVVRPSDALSRLGIASTVISPFVPTSCDPAGSHA